MRLREAYSLVDRCMANVSLDPEMAKRFRWDIEHLTTFYPHGLTSDQLRDKVAAMAEELLGLLDDAEGGGVRRRPRGGLLLHLGLLSDDLTKLEPIRRPGGIGAGISSHVPLEELIHISRWYHEEKVDSHA